MTRVACDVGQPRRMETCGAEEPYEGNLHVRFCGGIGRVIADPTRTGDRQQPPLVPRFGYERRLTPSVGRLRRGEAKTKRKLPRPGGPVSPGRASLHAREHHPTRDGAPPSRAG